MSIESRSIAAYESSSEENKSVVAYHRRDAAFGSTVQYTSSVVINIRDLQNDLQTQHQHDKTALVELNQRFQAFIDRVHILQTQNEKYLAAIADYRRQLMGFNNFDVQIDERYLSIKADLSTMYNVRIDYISDFEMFQLQSAIYQQLIAVEQQWKDNRALAFEEELKKSTTDLKFLRSSYAELQRQVEGLYAEGASFIKQYFALTQDLCNVKKHRNKWNLSVDTLKSYIGFYKNLRSYIVRGSSSVVIQTEDMEQYWRLELERVVRRVRADFEAFYSTIYREMTMQYETKMVQMETNVKQAVQYQKVEYEEFSSIYQARQIEYEKVQKSYSYEREVLLKLESSYSQLELEYKSIESQYQEQFARQGTELYSVQETIMTLVYDVEEIRRSKASLEAEIIVYRSLLESIGIEKPPTIIVAPESTGSEMTGKISSKGQRRKSIGIKECSPNGGYVSLMNYSANRDVDISRWIVTRHIDSVTKLRYVIPDGTILARGNELRIYAKVAGTSTAESSFYQKFVNKDLVSWGMGNHIETRLFNQNGDEEASFTQTMMF